MSSMNSEFKKNKKNSAPKACFLIKRSLEFNYRLSGSGTGNCDVAAVRRPSLSLVFYKEKCDKQSNSN